MPQCRVGLPVHHQKKNRAATLSGTSRVHLLRSAYAALAHACFDCGGRTVQAVAHRVCGHTDFTDALHYTALAVDVDPADKDALGPLPL